MRGLILKKTNKKHIAARTSLQYTEILKGETEREALLRETKEELGGEFAKLLQYQTLEELNKKK